MKGDAAAGPRVERPSPMSDLEERRLARARQLGEYLVRGPVSLWGLLDQGWTLAALEACLTESPDLFERRGDSVALTAKGISACRLGGITAAKAARRSTGPARKRTRK